MIIQLSIISAILGFLFILYIRRYDIWEPEPISKVILVGFLGGVISVLMSMFLYWLTESFGIKLHHTALNAYVFIGPIEEFSKLFAYLILYFAVFNKMLDEPVDTIIYMSSIALGFSVIENIMYALKGGADVLIFRYLITSPAHILFAIPMAIPLYLLVKKNGKLSAVLMFWAISATLHGTWDALAFNHAYFKLFSAMLILMFFYADSRLAKGLLASPFYPDLLSFFSKGKEKKKRDVWCLKCKCWQNLKAIKNDKILYFKCPTCNSILVDRDNGFHTIHYFFATFSNLSKEYLHSSKQPSLHTIKDCVYIDDKKRYGYVDINELASQVYRLRKEAKADLYEN